MNEIKHRKQNRLKGFDYSSNGYYYITICTQERKHYFGEIVNDEINLSEIGKIAKKYWFEIPNHFPFVKLNEFIVMPNHIHGIVVIVGAGFSRPINVD
jgi:REP element-mobilizing transposase RayT